MILGVDPGISGSFCLRVCKNDPPEFFDMPLIGNEIDLVELKEILSQFQVRAKIDSLKLLCYLEKAQSMPGNGGAHMFQYGRGFGSIEAMLCAHNISYHLIGPRIWTKVMHQNISGEDPKEKSAKAVNRLFPNLIISGNKKIREGRIDALLISEFGFWRESGKEIP